MKFVLYLAIILRAGYNVIKYYNINHQLYNNQGGEDLYDATDGCK